jgi:CubicO group peptidase (beta-lactamase class C family)
MEAVGTGKVLSQQSLAAQVGPNLVGFGHADPKCPVCQQNSVALNYGLGVVNRGPWITQSKSFAGSGATVGYLPSKKLTVAVVTTYGPGAFDDQGNCKNASETIFASMVNVLAPDTLEAGLMNKRGVRKANPAKAAGRSEKISVRSLSLTGDFRTHANQEGIYQTRGRENADSPLRGPWIHPFRN